MTRMKESTERIINIHEQLTELGFLHPDSESDSCPGSPVHRKAWSFGRQNSSGPISRSRASSVISIVSELSNDSEGVSLLVFLI